MGKYEKHSNKVVKRIADTYISLCCESGLSNVTLKLLCERADIYRSTFYNYFKNLDELLIHLEDEFLEQSEELWKRFGENYESEKFYDALLNLYYENRILLLVLMGPNGSVRFTNKYRRFLRQNLCHRFCLEGHLDIAHELALEYTTKGMLGGLYYLIRYSVTYDIPFHKGDNTIRRYMIMVSTVLTDQIFFQTIPALKPFDAFPKNPSSDS